MMNRSLLPIRSHVRGLTLMELMIAIAILGILMSLALPIYKDSIRKGRRSEAFSALTAVQQKQERWRANNASYSTDMSAATGLDIPTSTANGFYTISLDAADATSYTVRASAVGGTSQAEDGNCSQLRVRLAAGNQLNYGSASSGASSFDESVGNRCWSR